MPPRAAEKLNVGPPGQLGPNINDTRAALRESVKSAPELVDLVKSAADDFGVDLDQRPTSEDDANFEAAPVERSPQHSPVAKPTQELEFVFEKNKNDVGYPAALSNKATSAETEDVFDSLLIQKATTVECESDQYAEDVWLQRTRRQLAQLSESRNQLMDELDTIAEDLGVFPDESRPISMATTPVQCVRSKASDSLSRKALAVERYSGEADTPGSVHHTVTEHAEFQPPVMRKAGENWIEGEGLALVQHTAVEQGNLTSPSEKTAHQMQSLSPVSLGHEDEAAQVEEFPLTFERAISSPTLPLTRQPPVRRPVSPSPTGSSYPASTPTEAERNPFICAGYFATYRGSSFSSRKSPINDSRSYDAPSTTGREKGLSAEEIHLRIAEADMTPDSMSWRSAKKGSLAPPPSPEPKFHPRASTRKSIAVPSSKSPSLSGDEASPTLMRKAIVPKDGELIEALKTSTGTVSGSPSQALDKQHELRFTTLPLQRFTTSEVSPGKFGDVDLVSPVLRKSTILGHEDTLLEMGSPVTSQSGIVRESSLSEGFEAVVMSRESTPKPTSAPSQRSSAQNLRLLQNTMSDRRLLDIHEYLRLGTEEDNELDITSQVSTRESEMPPSPQSTGPSPLNETEILNFVVLQEAGELGLQNESELTPSPVSQSDISSLLLPRMPTTYIRRSISQEFPSIDKGLRYFAGQRATKKQAGSISGSDSTCQNQTMHIPTGKATSTSPRRLTELDRQPNFSYEQSSVQSDFEIERASQHLVVRRVGSREELDHDSEEVAFQPPIVHRATDLDDEVHPETFSYISTTSSMGSASQQATLKRQSAILSTDESGFETEDWKPLVVREVTSRRSNGKTRLLSSMDVETGAEELHYHPTTLQGDIGYGQISAPMIFDQNNTSCPADITRTATGLTGLTTSSSEPTEYISIQQMQDRTAIRNSAFETESTAAEVARPNQNPQPTIRKSGNVLASSLKTLFGVQPLKRIASEPAGMSQRITAGEVPSLLDLLPPSSPKISQVG